MGKITKIKASELTGRNIYHIKSQTIYYDFLSKTGYVITNSDVGLYTLFELNFPASLLIFLLVGYANNNYILGFAVGFAVFAVFDLLFRLWFLKRLPIVRNFVKAKKEPLTVRFGKELSYVRLIIIAILSWALTVMLIVNNFLLEYSTLYTVLNWILAIASFIFMIIIIITIIKKKKNNY